MKSPRAARLAALGLSPRWAGVLDGELPPEVVDVEAWWRDRYTGRRPWTMRDLRIVALRLRGDTVTQVADRLAVSQQTVRDRWLLVAPALVAGSGLDWVYAVPRTSGHRRALVRLGLEGPRPKMPPQPAPLPRDVVEAAWRAGTPLEEIATAAGLASRQDLAAALTREDLQLTPPRLIPADVARRYGLSRANVTNLMRAGRLPPPDGVDAGHSWWWPATTDAWAASRGRCPVCGAAVANLGAHRTVHASPGEVSTRG